MQRCPVCNNEIDDDASACPSCGFKLLGSTQSFKPIEFGQAPPAEPSHAERSCALRIVRGPQTGVVIEVQPGRSVIGRSPHCDIFLNDMTVSREHAALEKDAECCTITDTNSYNGVWVNNTNIASHRLVDGDVIQIGSFCLVYEEV